METKINTIKNIPYCDIKNFRLKKLNIPYPYNLEDPLLDVVDWDNFISNETDRLPMLIFNRTGLWPKEIPFDVFFQQERKVALLNVYYLSSYVNSLSLYKLPKDFCYKSSNFYEEVARFRIK